MLPKGKGYRVIGLWGKVRGELGEVLERWFGAETVGKGGFDFGGYGNQSTTSQVIHNHKIYTIRFIHYPIYTITQDNQDRDLVLRRKKKISLDYNNSFLGEYECSSLALDREERRDEKNRLDHLKQDQTMSVIKGFSDGKKVFRERKKTEKFVQRGHASGVVSSEKQNIESNAGSSYTYWVRETKVDDAPIHVPRKLTAANVSTEFKASYHLGSAWNKAGT
ncbi:hypothetical protein Tco_0476327 [Tanacetum coccineum]